MNYSTIVTPQNRHILIGNFGASVFIMTYIGIYGLGIIIYFTCHFLGDSRDTSENDIPSDFFRKFHQIKERQDIYNELSNEEWIRKVYGIYYSDQPNSRSLIETKTNRCSKKYHLKIQNLKSRDIYYVLDTVESPQLTTVSCNK